MDAEEGVWMPGVRFDGHLAEDRKTADIEDKKHYVTFSELHLAVLEDLIRMVDAAMKGMDGVGPRSAKAGRYTMSVSKDRKHSDIMDRAIGRGFITISRVDVDELRELAYTLRENMQFQDDG